VKASLEIDVLYEVLSDAASLGYDVLGVSGGEPTLYRQLGPLLRAAKDLGMRTTVTSNGTLLTDRRLSGLAGLVDVLAISLDGSESSHNRIRNHRRAFEMLDAHMPAVQASGIPFGFITTLTMHNVDELDLVVKYARERGARMVQVHPLEGEGNALDNLAESIPDNRELAFAVLEGIRLSELYNFSVQVDIARRADLVAQPERFLTRGPDASEPLGRWLSPLVIETDGTVVPLTYGFPPRYQLGNINATSLQYMARSWDSDAFLAVCRHTVEQLLATERTFFSWYEEVCVRARALTPASSNSTCTEPP
jgi:MoaA/NifB/PqqE/SkfB family radical SAM enzyme